MKSPLLKASADFGIYPSKKTIIIIIVISSSISSIIIAISNADDLTPIKSTKQVALSLIVKSKFKFSSALSSLLEKFWCR